MAKFTSQTAPAAARRRAEVWNARKAAALIAQHPDDRSEVFRIERLARVRIQLNRLDDLLASEMDPTRLDRLVSALNRLQDSEGWLAGRFKMGQVKPGTARGARSQQLTSGAPEPDLVSDSNPDPPAQVAAEPITTAGGDVPGVHTDAQTDA